MSRVRCPSPLQFLERRRGFLAHGGLTFNAVCRQDGANDWADRRPLSGRRHWGEMGRPWDAGGSRNWVRALLSLSRAIDAINMQIGRWCAWAILLAVAISATNAVVRKVFDMSSNAWLEMQWVLFSAVFL